MYGSGVGDLNVYLRSGNRDRKIWGLSGDAGNNWYLAQAAVASSTPFKVHKKTVDDTLHVKKDGRYEVKNLITVVKCS